jgi:hypothetical protein
MTFGLSQLLHGGALLLPPAVENPGRLNEAYR